MKMVLWLVYRKSDCLVLAEGFVTEKAAEFARTRKLRRYLNDSAVATREDFDNNIDHDVTVKCLVTGRPMTIKASEVGSCVDPSTERYWNE